MPTTVAASELGGEGGGVPWVTVGFAAGAVLLVAVLGGLALRLRGRTVR